MTLIPQTHIVRLRGAIRCLRRASKRMEAQDIDALLTVYLRPGIHVHELGAEVGVTPSAASRIVYRLSSEYTPGVPGLGLFQTETDPSHRRKIQVFLTPKGTQMIESLVEQLETESR